MLLTTKTFSLTILFLCLVKLISFLLFETNFVFMLFALMLFGNSPFTPPLILLGQKKIQLLSADEVSHSHLNADEALNERIINA